METKQMISIYTLQPNGLLVLIPKKRGTGFCKSVFGFHSSNKECRLFDDIKPNWFCNDTTDIEGYLHIELRLNSWDERFDEGLKLTFDALKEVFPFITEFKEDNKQFWNVIMDKNR